MIARWQTASATRRMHPPVASAPQGWDRRTWRDDCCRTYPMSPEAALDFPAYAAPDTANPAGLGELRGRRVGPFRESPAVPQFEVESLGNQQVQCALRKVDARQDIPSCSYRAILLVLSLQKCKGKQESGNVSRARRAVNRPTGPDLQRASRPGPTLDPAFICAANEDLLHYPAPRLEESGFGVNSDTLHRPLFLALDAPYLKGHAPEDARGTSAAASAAADR